MSLPIVASPVVLGAQRPRILHVPEYVSSAGEEAIELAAVAGLQLDEWQRFILMGALGERADGKWAAFEVGEVVSRQNGKGSVLEARELAGAILFGERLLIHSAHEQATSTEHFLRLLALIEEAEFTSRLKRPVYGKGSEAILFKDGTRILFKTRTGGSGRGFTGDFVGLDEAMILAESFVGALEPTMAARSMLGNPQMWYAGSVPDQQNPKHDGVVLARLRSRALRRAPDVAYFEWSVDADSPAAVTEAMRTDPQMWAMANPAMGIRISSEHIARECNGSLGPREFAVERLGVGDWPAIDEGAGGKIPRAAWEALVDPHSKRKGVVAFAFDVTPDGNMSAIAAAGHRADGLRHIEVVEHAAGSAWVPGRLKELKERHDPMAIVCDEKGPATALMPALKDEGVEVYAVSASEHAQACGMFVSAVTDEAGATLRHLGTPELAAALRGASTRPLGEAWAWSRRSSSVDISPLVACTLAHWGRETLPQTSVYEDRGVLVVSFD